MDPVSLTVAVLLVAIPIGLLPFWRSRRPEDRNALNPAKLFMIYLIVQLSVSGLISVCIVHLIPYTIDPQGHEGVYLKAAGVYLLAVLAFNAGHWATFGEKVQIPRRLFAEWNPRKQALVGTLLVLAGYAAVAVLVIGYGGLSAMFENREEFRAYGIIGKGYLVYPMTMGLTLGCLLSIDLLLRRPPSAARSWAVASYLVLSVLPAIVTGFRGFMLMPLIVFSIYYNYNVRSLYSLKGALSFGTLILFFVGYGIWREIPPGIEPLPALEFVAETRPDLFFGPLTRSAGLETAAQIVDTMDSNPQVENDWFLPGIYETLTIPIPLALWPDKPEPTGARSGKLFFLDNLRLTYGADFDNPSGTSITLIGWGYWQGGVLGVALGGFFFGWLLRRLVDLQREWGSLTSVRIGFAMLAPPLILSCEEPQNYLSMTFTNIVVLGSIVFWMSKQASPIPSSTPALGPGKT